MIAVIDVEISNTVEAGLPIDSPSQPHVCAMAGILFTEDFLPVQQCHFIIRPNHWKIHEKMTAVHGIDQVLAEKYGVSIQSAMAALILMTMNADRLVGYGLPYNLRRLHVELDRMGRNAEWPREGMEQVCVMKLMADEYNDGRNLRFVDAVQKVPGIPMPDNSCLQDVEAIAKLYQAVV